MEVASFFIYVVMLAELMLLLLMWIATWRLSVQAAIVAKQRRRLNDEADTLIGQAQQAATATLKKSAHYSEQMLSATADIRTTVTDSITEEIDRTAHSEKLLFKESLRRARHENVAAWQALRHEIERETETVLASFKKQLQTQLDSELTKLQASAADYQKKQREHLAELLTTRVDQLAKEVLHQAIPLETQKELVEAAIAHYDR